MPERTPNLRASYDAVVSTPPPTPKATPLSVGSASSSQLALSGARSGETSASQLAHRRQLPGGKKRRTRRRRRRRGRACATGPGASRASRSDQGQGRSSKGGWGRRQELVGQRGRQCFPSEPECWWSARSRRTRPRALEGRPRAAARPSVVRPGVRTDGRGRSACRAARQPEPTWQQRRSPRGERHGRTRRMRRSIFSPSLRSFSRSRS